MPSAVCATHIGRLLSVKASGLLNGVTAYFLQQDPAQPYLALDDLITQSSFGRPTCISLSYQAIKKASLLQSAGGAGADGSHAAATGWPHFL